MSNGTLYSFGPFLLSPEQMVLSVDGSVVPVPLKALKTLLTLIEHGGEVVSKQVLIEAVWPDSYVEEGNLTQNIFLLRRQLGKAPEGQDYIETIPRRGYGHSRIIGGARSAPPEDRSGGGAEVLLETFRPTAEEFQTGR